MNYEKLVEKIIGVLKMEDIIDDAYWGIYRGQTEVLDIIKDNHMYSFENKKNSEEIKITIDTLED